MGREVEHATGLSVRPLLMQETLPLLVEPLDRTRQDLSELHRLVDDQLHETGALLLRGFDVLGEHAFQALVRGFGHELLNYEFGSTPRKAIEQGVYTSTEYPAHQTIPLHNEQSYTLQWPMKIWFHCVQPSAEGGETPIADSRRIFQQLDPALRQRFTDKRLMYVRNYGNGLDLSWEQAFNTEDRAVAEAYCRANSIAFEWKEDGELRTRQVCQAVARHPKTQAWVWFNQAHLFHVSNLAPAIRESLMAVVDDDPLDLPRNVYYGDGSELEESALDEIRGVLAENSVCFPWEKGDVLMLDNMLVAHGRASFKGPRQVIVAMAEPAQEQN
ncbi:TauD/TfdA family dioxygenase [Pseudomonas brassicacearum]|uniref:TauD/TfdA family dioxygenase n=1 Tax=Pseudomonas brassicacearum subsp. neoaurantiaca TaxID=494916 RepID=A0A7V8UFD1_9PSED|nr:TauD/TfdA family dioxygenase [Pseudomonas brassicacearum]MBA1380531.1 TauD/TfdA family dioxygenase [Pseudomonas brassicacearum subsp. neoaurantiaca]